MVKFGVVLPIRSMHGTTDAKKLSDYARAAERLGFESAWAHDRLLHPTYSCLDPIATLSYVAAITTRIRLGTQGLLLPLHNPALLAKSLATLDNLSDGRVILGVVMGGGDQEKEGRAAGVAENERFKRFTEAIKTIRLLWDEDVPVTYETPFWALNEAVMLPRPKSQPRLPIWIGAYSDRSLERVARIGDGWLGGHLMSPERAAGMVAKLRGYCGKVGRNPDDLGTCKPVYAFVDSNEARARLRAGTYIKTYYPPMAAGIDGRKPVWRSGTSVADPEAEFDMAEVCAVGTPSEVAAHLSKVAASGIGEILVDTLSADAGDLEVLASKVFPLVRSP